MDKINLKSDYNLNKLSIDELKSSFFDYYKQFREVREMLHNAQINNSMDKDNIKQQILQIKENLALTTLSIYKKSDNFRQFKQIIYKELFPKIGIYDISTYTNEKITETFKNINLNKNADEKDIDKEMLQKLERGASMIYPVSLEEGEYITSPIEGIVSTINLLGEVDRYVEVAKDKSDGIILSGSINWGSFLNTKGLDCSAKEIYGKQKGYEIMTDKNRNSDLDMLMSFDSLENMKSVINNLVEKGLFPSSDSKRVEKFIQLYNEGKSDFFSCKKIHDGKKIGVHFFLTDKLKDVLTIKEADEQLYINDFRPGLSDSEVKFGGYKIYDLNDTSMDNQELFKNEYEKIDNLGYISKSPVTTYRKKDNKLLCGFITGHTIQKPVIARDKNGIMSDIMNNERETIKKYGGNPDLLIKKLRNGRLPSYFDNIDY